MRRKAINRVLDETFCALVGEKEAAAAWKEDRPLQPTPRHIFLADTRHHLGISSADRIDPIKLGWPEGILI
jgi:hypothetical protein